MTRDISDEFKAHMAGKLTTIARCCRIVRTDGTIHYFTNHDADLEIDGNTYEPAKGLDFSAVEASPRMNVDNINFNTFLKSDVITKADLAANLYDGATVDIFDVNYEDLSQGKLYWIQGGLLGEVEIRDYAGEFEVRGKVQRLQQAVGRLYTPGCAHDFCDSSCGLDVDTHYTDAGGVTSVTDRRVFVDTSFMDSSGADDLYTGGLLTWTEPESGDSFTGNNAGLSMEVKKFDPVTGEFELFESMAYEIEVGDEFEVTWGCDKKASTCKDRYDNIVNFGGFPHLPGMGKMMDYESRPPEIS